MLQEKIKNKYLTSLGLNSIRWPGLFTSEIARKHRQFISPHKDFKLSFSIFHPYLILSSSFFHPHYIIPTLSSAIRHPPSAIRHPPSAIRHPVDTFQIPAISILCDKDWTSCRLHVARSLIIKLPLAIPETRSPTVLNRESDRGK